MTDETTYGALEPLPGDTQPADEINFFENSPLADLDWAEGNWKEILEYLISEELVSYKEIASLVLGHLNPSQVGTSIASKKTFQAHYPRRETMRAVVDWHKEQTGHCFDCGTRLELQADHVETREEYGDAADRLENMTLRCRRCNVIRRPSHKNGGKTFLTTESALMWILLVRRPTTYQEYEQLCREYGLTMANIRFKEAWAMARWLEREGKYTIDPASSF
ncbi:MAG: hypothetical protein LH624_05115 [Cryobacterium sp.]|nr:hypothetical protein [Cryobacterium sp.]